VAGHWTARIYDSHETLSLQSCSTSRQFYFHWMSSSRLRGSAVGSASAVVGAVLALNDNDRKVRALRAIFQLLIEAADSPSESAALRH